MSVALSQCCQDLDLLIDRSWLSLIVKTMCSVILHVDVAVGSICRSFDQYPESFIRVQHGGVHQVAHGHQIPS